MKVQIIAHTPNPEEVVAQAAKLCYSQVGVDGIMEKLTPEKIESFVDHLATIGHESPLEHVSFTFAIEGISRVTSHQAVRHRLASFSQQSQRYVRLDQFEYIIPPEIEKNEDAKKIFIETMERDQQAYEELVMLLVVDKIDKRYPGWTKDEKYLEEYNKYNSDKTLVDIFKEHNKKEYNALEKEAIEDARYVFPNACETKIVITMNARSLLHFFNVRCCRRAQWEIRQMADEMLKECKKVAPTLFKKAGPNCTFGKCGEGSMSCGHPRKPEEFE
jgi:thymidylate synthase (FAD)